MKQTAVASYRAEKNQKSSHFQGLFLVLFIVLAGFIFINSGLFAVQEVTVRGNRAIPAEDILLTAGLNHSKNIFQIDVAQIRQEILRNPKVASVEVMRIFPRKIIITIKERQPACFLLYLDNLLVIGEDGVIMGVKEESDPLSLPVVTGVSSRKMRLGEKVQDSSFKLALDILKYADENSRQVISEINLNSCQLNINFPNSPNTITVELGTATDIAKKMYNLRAILSQTSPDELAKIDLRIPDLPTVIRLTHATKK